MTTRGGKRTGAGRKAGVPNKVTAELRALARTHVSMAIAELARLATRAESESARVAAIKSYSTEAMARPLSP